MWLMYFVLLLGGLIFFHELGHFLAGKAMGVRVLKFAIGFGPSIPGLRFKRGETEYSINLLPIGGYVKFFGDDPTEELSPEERKGSFNHAPLARRFLIVLAGPLFNMILPLLLFFPMFLLEGETESPVLGHVVAGGPADIGGLLSGDVVVQIDGQDITTWWEMERKVANGAGQTLQFSVRRDGAVDGPYAVRPEDVVVRSIKELDWEERKGRIQVTHQAIAPVIAAETASVAFDAGLRTGDRVVAVATEPVGDGSWEFVERRLRAHAGETIPVIVHRPELPSLRAMATVGAAALWNPVTVQLPVRAADEGVDGLRSAELVVARVEPATPAQGQIHLLPGDQLLAVDGKPLRSWTTLASELLVRPDAVHTLRFERGGVFTFVANAAAGVGDAAPLGRTLESLVGSAAWAWVSAVATPGRHVEERSFRIAERGKGADRSLVFGAYNDVDLIAPAPVSPGFGERLSYAAIRSWEDTLHAYKITLMTVAGLFAGRVPMKDLGGPILIADLAAKTQERGWGYFLVLMVWLSINLGVLNLLPVPILDGGHLMFFTIEAIKRKPVSLRTRQFASYVGLAIIVLLMGLALKNDLERSWESITGALGCSAGF